jgi:DNA polymerase-3 subunit gamma/tau
MYLALARKWRPQRFEDVIGQRGVVETLKNAITSGRLAQSFIFAGPRGVGKTTTARILARALNCVTGPTAEPCGTCDACIEIAEGRDVDVMEIDGATYTGVDAVREVIVEPLSIAPMRDRYKIFIIDEVHRLSPNAFDALLKSIEEPPPYVLFMMATTEPGKVPGTIRSRSQVFELRTLPFPAIRQQLADVASKEGIAIDDAALVLVARAAEGSMRDALSALDQVLSFTSERITTADVSTVLGLIGRDLQFDIAELVAREDAGAAFELADRVVESGVDLRTVCRELSRLMRDLMVVTIDPSRLADPEIAAEGERERLEALAQRYSREDLLRSFDLLAAAETAIRYASQPRHQFEMALLKWIYLRQLTPLSELIAGGASGAPAPRRPAAPGTKHSAPSTRHSAQGTAAPSTRHSAPSTTPSAPGTAARITTHSAPSTKSAPSTQNQVLSTALLSAIREQNKTLYSMVIAQAQKIDVEGDTIAFTFAPVHRALKAQLEGKRGWVESLASSAAGRTIRVDIREGEAAPAPAAAEDAASRRKAELTARAKAEPGVQTVLDVFGGEIEDVEEIQE